MALFASLRNRHGFFSDYWLGTIFGRAAGRQRTLLTRDVERAWATFVRIYERAEGRAGGAPEVRERFARPFLGTVFGYHLGTPDGRFASLYPSAEDEAAGRAPLLRCYIGEWDEDLDGGRTSPTRTLAEALAKATGDERYGLLITGKQIRLVRRAGDGPRSAYLELDLEGCLEAEDKESFAAALRLFSVSIFRPDAHGTLPIDQIERENRDHAERVSDKLKYAVFQAAETLAQALLDGDVAVASERLTQVRDAALACLYRMLFVLYAEARDPRLLAHALYRDSYSLDELVRDILHGRVGTADNRFGVWYRLLALFAIYDRGLPGLDGLEPIPARGGDLFSPTTPAGRILEEARLSDRVVARVLVDLTTTPPRRGVGREQISFRELGIEQLGAVYEGLLEYEPRVATDTALEVRVQGRASVLSPADLVRLARTKRLRLHGDLELVARTEAEVLHPEAADDADELDEDQDEADDDREETEDAAVGEEEASIRKGATALVLRRLEPGRFYFAPGQARKGSGSFYTPLPLVRDLVRRTLGPLVEGKRPAEIEALGVLDPACGSAHFLVEAMRFLGQALHRAYVEEGGGKAPSHFRGRWGTHWQASDEEARAGDSEARAWCKRRVAERCLFGVDLNPTAVELARVSLWIESLAGDRPLTYFAHHLRCGNSLLGTWLERLALPPLQEMGARGSPAQLELFREHAKELVREAAHIRRLIDIASDTGAVAPETLEELRFKEEQRRRAEDVLSAAKLLFDLRSASAFIPEIWREWDIMVSLLDDGARLEEHTRSRPWYESFEKVRRQERFFHWELEFPEVFLDGDRPGFDAVLGNPPWDKVLPSKHEFYGRYDVLIRAYKGNDLERRIKELHEAAPELAAAFREYRARTTRVAQLLRRGGDFPLSRGRSQAPHEDVSKYFLDRALRLARAGGRAGMVVPSVVYNGDGCVGLRRYFLTHCAIERCYGFENRRKVFPIDSRYKFVDLVVAKGGTADRFQVAFMRHDVSELTDDGPKPWVVSLTREEIERLSPDTLAFLEYRSPRDQELVHGMHEGRPTLGGEGPGSWGTRMFTDLAHLLIYNSARDKDLWTDPKSGRLYTPRHVLGREPTDFGDLLQRMRERGFWPVFEGKHIDQWLVGIKPVRWWLSVEQAERKYGRPPRSEPTLVFRETARNTDERTCIAAVLPAQSAASHSLSGILLERVDLNAAATVLNSLPFDWMLRLRSAGTNVSFTYMKPIAVPPAEVVNRLPRVPTQLAWERRVQHVTEVEGLWPVLWEANRAVAEAYGLAPGDFGHMLGTFPGVARKRREFFRYLQEWLARWHHGAEGIPASAPVRE